MPYQALESDWSDYDDELVDEESYDHPGGEEKGGELDEAVHDIRGDDRQNDVVETAREVTLMVNETQTEVATTLSEPQAPPSQTSRPQLRVRKDAWSWSDTEDDSPPAEHQDQPSYITLSSDSEESETSTKRKRKRSEDEQEQEQEHDAIYHQPKRKRNKTRLFSASSRPGLRPKPRDTFVSYPTPQVIRSGLFSVGSVKFPTTPSTTKGAGVPDEAKLGYSMTKSAIAGREYQRRKVPMVRAFSQRFHNDKGTVLKMIGALQSDNRWLQMNAEARETFKTTRVRELMEKRFTQGKSEAYFLSHLLQVVSQRGYSEGVLLRLLLQNAAPQRLLGDILEDVIDIEDGIAILKENSTTYEAEEFP